MRQAFVNITRTLHRKLSVPIVLAGSAFIIAGCGTEADQGSETSQVIGANNLELIEAAKGTNLYQYAQPIAFARMGGYGCTATRVAKDLFLTNHHCWEGTSCDTTTFTMGYERDTPKANQKSFACSGVVAKSKELDYALYRVRYTASDSAADSYPIATLSRAPHRLHMPLFIAGFPNGYAYKRMDRSAACRLSETAGTRYTNFIGHTCDTISGSSGSPVLDRSNGRIIALHWGHMTGKENHATAISKVLDHIKANAPSAHKQLKISY